MEGREDEGEEDGGQGEGKGGREQAKTEREEERTTGHPPRLVLLPAQPHPDCLLHHDAGAGSVQNLVLHCETETKDCQVPANLTSEGRVMLGRICRHVVRPHRKSNASRAVRGSLQGQSHGGTLFIYEDNCSLSWKSFIMLQVTEIVVVTNDKRS